MSSRSTSTKLFSSLANRLDGLDQPTVWHEFSPLAVEYGSINLGQGFPDWEPPAFVKECMHDAIFTESANQYTRSYAHLPLATVLAEDYTEKFQREIDPATMIASAVGCTNALYCALQGLLNQGDEVICIEPAFDIYCSQVQMAGGKPVFVPLRSNDAAVIDAGHDHVDANDKFVLDLQELENAITDRTRVFILNSPHNPTGKIFSRSELEGIADIIRKHPQITVIADEVYERIVFQDKPNKPNEHVHMATIPGMWDQTLTLSSSGKTFSCTGWKVGWAVGPAHLVKAVTAVQQWVNFSSPTPNQHAIAKALRKAKKEEYTDKDGRVFENYYAWLVADYQRKRGLLVKALQAAGMTPIIPQGGFFIMADTKDTVFPYEEVYKNQRTPSMPASAKFMPRDWALSRWLTTTVGVTAIPPSAFYCPERMELAQNYLRFAFCKGDETILEAHSRLEKYFAGK